MPKQTLNEVKSSPASSCPQQDTCGQEKQPVANTVSAPAFLEEYLHYPGYYTSYKEEEEGEDDDDENEDKKRELFRNRLFSTWKRQLPATTSKHRRTKEGCDIINTIGWEPEKSENRPDSQEQSDEDVDNGYAWIILIVMFVINASTFGTARAYGLIFENSARRGEQSRSEAALPFTIMGAVENMAGPLTGYLLARTGSWRVVVFVGSCLITLSHLLAAYFDSQPGQILTIGLMCGIGQSFISISSFQINNAYFVRYRSRAFGIGLTGAAVGTIYISPLCQFVLDNHSKSLCYLMLGFILFPNVPLSLLLKPKETTTNFSNLRDSGSSDNQSQLSKSEFVAHPEEVVGSTAETSQLQTAIKQEATVFSISNQLALKQSQESTKTRARLKEEKDQEGEEEGFWRKASQVLATPLFHLIWPTQLLFCWLNFVFGMIITDFGKDRGLSEMQNSHLIVIWASGQLFGRLCLGSLVDLGILSHKSFTIVCLASISLITFMLNSSGTTEADQEGELASNMICLLVFILSMFISTLYILFNGLVVNHMDKSLTALSVGISSFTGSFFLLPRATIIGHYRDTGGNYDAMLTMFTCVTMLWALVWLLVPPLCSYVRRCNQAATISVQVSHRLTGC